MKDTWIVRMVKVGTVCAEGWETAISPSYLEMSVDAPSHESLYNITEYVRENTPLGWQITSVRRSVWVQKWQHIEFPEQPKMPKVKSKKR